MTSAIWDTREQLATFYHHRVPCLQLVTLERVVDCLHQHQRLHDFDMTTRGEIVVKCAEKLRDVSKEWTDVSPVNVVKLVRVHPLVFGIVDLEVAVWRNITRLYWAQVGA